MGLVGHHLFLDTIMKINQLQYFFNSCVTALNFQIGLVWAMCPFLGKRKYGIIDSSTKTATVIGLTRCWEKSGIVQRKAKVLLLKKWGH